MVIFTGRFGPKRKKTRREGRRFRLWVGCCGLFVANAQILRFQIGDYAVRVVDWWFTIEWDYIRSIENDGTAKINLCLLLLLFSYDDVWEMEGRGASNLGFAQYTISTWNIFCLRLDEGTTFFLLFLSGGLSEKTASDRKIQSQKIMWVCLFFDRIKMFKKTHLRNTKVGRWTIDVWLIFNDFGKKKVLFHLEHRKCLQFWFAFPCYLSLLTIQYNLLLLTIQCYLPPPPSPSFAASMLKRRWTTREKK